MILQIAHLLRFNFVRMPYTTYIEIDEIFVCCSLSEIDETMKKWIVLALHSLKDFNTLVSTFFS